MENKIEPTPDRHGLLSPRNKRELDGLKATISGIEKSLEQAWEYIEDHTAELKAHKGVKDSQQKEIDELKSHLQKTSLLLNNTRGENLKFMNLPDDRGED